MTNEYIDPMLATILSTGLWLWFAGMLVADYVKERRRG